VSILIQATTVFEPVLYFALMMLYGMGLGGPRAPHVQGMRRAVWWLAILVGLTNLVARGVATDQFPITETWTSLSAAALLTTLFFGWMTRSAKTPTTGVLVIGVVFLMQLSASAFGPIEPVLPDRRPDLFYGLHVVTSIAAVAALALSGVHGLLYRYAYRRMRERSFGPLMSHLPSLDQLASLMRSAALAGFLFLAVGVNAGIGFAHALTVPGFRYSDPWVLAMFAIWIHFGVVAFSKYIPGFNARRASFASATGFVVLLVAMLVQALAPHLSFHLQS
jgi:ABC-type uncharacterized transport system permease subunit